MTLAFYYLCFPEKPAMIYDSILHKKGKGEKQLAVLVDPDKATGKQVIELAKTGQEHGLDLFLVGSSIMLKDRMEAVIRLIRNNCDIPVILFPGSILQISSSADALLLLSLISGRNPEFLIDRHVAAAPLIRRTKLEVVPTAYMLFGNGKITSAHYLSGSFPIPPDKPDLAVATAMAGEMLGLRMIYLEAGSGADSPVPTDVITSVREAVDIPLIVGGGLRNPEAVKNSLEAGADVVVVGTALEQKPADLPAFMQTIRSAGR